jgi:DNA polymerase
VAWLERGGVVGVPVGEGVVAPPKPAVARPAPAVAPATAPAPPAPPVAEAPPRVADGSAATRLAQIREVLGDCQRCKLAGKRTNIVYGVGNPDAPLVFVGTAGQLLTKMIEAMGFARDDVYICNILKCRPPGNRNPEPDEIAECEPFLKKQLAAIRPRMIVALGKFAAQCLLRSDAPISKLRGAWKQYEGIPLMPTYHPAFLLRTPSAKREVWADLQEVMRELDRLGIPRGGAK